MARKNKSQSGWTLDKVIPWLLFAGGIIGAIASAILTMEMVSILKNPHYIPVCNLNPILSCSTVTTSDQAEAFGFPNEFLGLIGYGAVAAIGLAVVAGGKFRRWYWQIINFGLLLATLFITWLQFQTLYRIGALCIFCMVVWAVTIPMFWYTTLYNLREGNIDPPRRLQKASLFAQKHHGDILLLWFLIVLALILKRFWYYWSTLI